MVASGTTAYTTIRCFFFGFFVMGEELTRNRIAVQDNLDIRKTSAHALVSEVRTMSGDAKAIEPANMSELVTLADAAGKSNFFGAKTREQALLIMMSGRDLGLSYSQALRAFHVIEGRPALSADGMVAACLMRSDVCEYFRTVEVSDAKAVVETQRRGSKPQRYEFAKSDAERAGLWGRANWGKYPSRMLLARARAALARDVYPDLLLGLYDPDELADAKPGPAAPPTVITKDGEVITPAPASSAAHASIEAVIKNLALIEAGGTKEQLDHAAQWIKENATEAERGSLAEPYARARAAIRVREKAVRPAPPPPREPGDDSDVVSA